MPAIIHKDGKVESLYSHEFDNGLKLMEHSWIGNAFVNCIYSEILKNPKRIAWIGDYSNDFDDSQPEAYHRNLTFEQFCVYYDAVWGEDVKHLGKDEMIPEAETLMDVNTNGTYLVNHDQKQFLDIGKYIKRATTSDGWCANPLPLLTACGNDRGGGDFYRSADAVGYEKIGIWAFDTLEYTNDRPASGEEVFYTFIEHTGVEEKKTEEAV